MTTAEIRKYRGPPPMAQWCASVYATRADLPLLTSSTLRTLAPRKEEAVAETKQRIDHILSRLDAGGNRQSFRLGDELDGVSPWST
jgi:hypothetical protein